MIIAIDVETRGLDATEFLTGCILKEGASKPEIFRDKQALWNRVLSLGRALAKRGKILNVYSHNANYDFHAYADLHDKNIEWFSTSPFILAYKENGKEIIKFLDTLSLYPMALKDVGDILGVPKLETPQELMSNDCVITEEKLKEIETYMVRDTELCLNAVLYLKDRLKKNNINVRRLYTISQIAINYLTNYLKKKENMKYLFLSQHSGLFIPTKREAEIHAAYRGGRVQCFQLGEHKNATWVDCNSLYPYTATQIPFPDLRTEKYLYDPLKRIHQDDLLQLIGIGRCLMKNVSSTVALLPTRTNTFNYYPGPGKTLLGTWTFEEIRTALHYGYELIAMEWAVVWKEAPENPLKEFMETMYIKRKESKDMFDNFYFKSMMNSCIGKLAQRKNGEDVVIDSVEKTQEYLDKKYKVIKGIKENWVYSKKREGRKKYYAPIIPTLINAYARTYMFKYFLKIPMNDLLYTDTDSIIFTGSHTHTLPLGKKLGQFKIEQENERVLIYARKHLKIGTIVKLAGVSKRNVTPELFEKGIITDTKMISYKSASEGEVPGKFITTMHDLSERRNNYEKSQALLADEELYVDHDIHDISYFIDNSYIQ